MIILDNFSMLGRTAIITSDDIMYWDSRKNISTLRVSEKTIEILKNVDCIMFISSMSITVLPKEIRDLLGVEVVPKANIYRYRLRDLSD